MPDDAKKTSNKVATWFEAVETLQPHVVRISTPRGTGTGFLVSQVQQAGISAIATAAHVIDQAHYWEEPIRLHHLSSGVTALVHQGERAIFLDNQQRDTAVILIKNSVLPLPSAELPLIPAGNYIKVGSGIGWLGFPAIPAANLCFFGGRISAWLEQQRAYLVDGVAINGVSGGPAFILGLQDAPSIMGVVSAYMPNRATGETLPGLSVVRDVSQFHELAPKFKSLEQAKSKETPSTPPPNVPLTTTGTDETKTYRP